ncbi:hypothetical protein WL200_09870 [Staphylococcus capitis]|uniref:hypothetical protein n=4 Tax=Staphylococcus TaxID=1279 RepID=UPI0021B6B9BD|nr:hypothetical protein [Staphylococcus capitis]UZX46874.1 hypothetical protein OP858_00385 [Staphylococcus capitis]
MASTPRTVITNILGLISLLMAIGTIVLFGFNTPIKSIITIAAVAVTGLILASIIGSLIKNSTYYTYIFQCHGNKGKSQSLYIRNIYPL